MKRTINRILLCGVASLWTLGGNLFAQETAQHDQTLPYKVDATEVKGNYKITYNPSRAGLSKTLPVQGVVYTYKDFVWTGHDVAFHKKDSLWIANYKVPEGVGLLMSRFWQDGKVDRGQAIPYMVLLDKTLPGASSEYFFVRRKLINSNMRSPLVNSNVYLNPKAALIWLPIDMQHMSVKRARLWEMSDALKEANDNKVNNQILDLVAEVSSQPDLTEKELLDLRSTYSHVLKDSKKADSIHKVILQKFPEGITYRRQLLNQLITGNLTFWEKFQKDWPKDKYSFSDYTNPRFGESFFFMGLTNIINRYYMDGDWKNVLNTLSIVPFDQLGYFYDHFVDYPHRTPEQLFPEKDLLSLGRSIIDTIETRMVASDNYRSGRGLHSPEEWKKEVLKKFSSAYAYHTGMLYRNGFYREAMLLADRLKPYIGLSDVNFNDVYVKLLVKMKRKNESYPFIRSAVRDGAYTTEMIEVIKDEYLSKGRDEKKFDQYVHSLKSKESIEREHATIIKSMCNLPSAAFSLKNLKGEQVDLSRQIGKIVVLDFWATWCFPCKQAMPGMQLAVNKYAKDPNVNFYFISTMETDPNYKTYIDKFLKENQYSFNVLYDEKSASGKMDRVYNDYSKTVKSSGIPLKVIIDQNGKIRWFNLGGSSNAVQIAEEVSFVIDLLKKENI